MFPCCFTKVIRAVVSKILTSKTFAYLETSFVFARMKLRSSCLQMFFKIVFLKTFANLTGKHLRWNLFFDKVAGLRLGISL